jgi:hypothetical protein
MRAPGVLVFERRGAARGHNQDHGAYAPLAKGVDQPPTARRVTCPRQQPRSKHHPTTAAPLEARRSSSALARRWLASQAGQWALVCPW